MMEARLYVVSYDISSPRRWKRVQGKIKGLCRRGQLSVFVCRATPARMARLERELRGILHARDDRLMILDLGSATIAARQVSTMNSINDIAELEAAIL